jgi:hypothetical protein
VLVIQSVEINPCLAISPSVIQTGNHSAIGDVGLKRSHPALRRVSKVPNLLVFLLDFPHNCYALRRHTTISCLNPGCMKNLAQYNRLEAE